MFEKNKGVIVAALLIAATTTIIGVSANNKNDSSTTKNKAAWEQRHAEMEVFHEKLDVAIESGNFETFQAAVAENPMGEKLLEKLNADNFSRFAEAHGYKKEAMELMQKSRDIMKELGFEDLHKNGMGIKMGRMMHKMKGIEKPQTTTSAEQ